MVRPLIAPMAEAAAERRFGALARATRLLIRAHAAAVVCAPGILSGFCSTLVTPIAANFDIVPAASLELPDRNGIIRVHVPTALILLMGNIILMYALAFRR